MKTLRRLALFLVLVVVVSGVVMGIRTYSPLAAFDPPVGACIPQKPDAAGSNVLPHPRLEGLNVGLCSIRRR